MRISEALGVTRERFEQINNCVKKAHEESDQYSEVINQVKEELNITEEAELVLLGFSVGFDAGVTAAANPAVAIARMMQND